MTVSAFRVFNSLGNLGIALALAGLLASCSTTDNDTEVANAQLGITYGVKQFQFEWPSVTGATFYRLSENADGGSGFTTLVDNLQARQYTLNVALFNRLNASYMLEACNTGGCFSSDTVNVANAIDKAVGYFKASNAEEGDAFGYSVALSDNGLTMAVGAYLEDSTFVGAGVEPNDTFPEAGAVYVFSRLNDAWQQEAYIKASNADDGDHFGLSLALSADGNTLAVGAPNEAGDKDSTIGNLNEEGTGAGAVYVFIKSSNGWNQQAYIKAFDALENNFFGTSVALSDDGNTLVSGAPGRNSTQFNTGAAYVFERSTNLWSQKNLLTASDADADDAFGTSVAIAGNGETIAIGATGNDSVYVFTKNNNAWSQQDFLKSNSTEAGDRFGQSVALSEDGKTLAVGADEEDGNATSTASSPNNSASAAGAAYVFKYANAAWTQQRYVKASNAKANDHFGHRVSLSDNGNTLAVGANKQGDTLSTTDQGAVYVFTFASDVWTETANLTATNAGTNDHFGDSVVLSGNGQTLAIGAAGEDAQKNDLNDSGAVYLY